MKNLRLKFFPVSKIHLMILVLFAAAFCTGSLLGKTTGQLLPDCGSVSASSGNTSWGLSFQEKGKRPIGNASIEELEKYNAYYAANTEEKIIYLTFDCGYENGNMPKILEALKKHQVSAAFFVVGNFISDHPDLLRKMIQAGHTIGNHTMRPTRICLPFRPCKDSKKNFRMWKSFTNPQPGPLCKNTIDPQEESTAPPIFPWQKNWDIKPFSGVLPM